MNYEQQIVNLVESDALRMKALAAVDALGLPDWLIAAGFVRNLVWGDIFGIEADINDIDAIYFCGRDTSEERDRGLEDRLFEVRPELPWSVKNQARMHIRNGDRTYENTLDAMSFWPEKQTAIGVKLDAAGKVVVRHCFDLALQFSGAVNRNPKRSMETFNSRVAGKGWLTIWPSLRVET